MQTQKKTTQTKISVFIVLTFSTSRASLPLERLKIPGTHFASLSLSPQRHYDSVLVNWDSTKFCWKLREKILLLIKKKDALRVPSLISSYWIPLGDKVIL